MFLDRPGAGLPEHLARLGAFPHFLPLPPITSHYLPLPSSHYLPPITSHTPTNPLSLGPFLSGQGHTYSFCNVSFSSYVFSFSPRKPFLAAPSVASVLASAKPGPAVPSLDPSVSLPPSTLTGRCNWFHMGLSHQTGNFSGVEAGPPWWGCNPHSGAGPPWGWLMLCCQHLEIDHFLLACFLSEVGPALPQ